MQITSITEALNSHLIQGEAGSPTAVKPLNTPNPISDEYDRTPGGTPLEHFIGEQPQDTYPIVLNSPDDNAYLPTHNNTTPTQVNSASGHEHTQTSDDEYILAETTNAEAIIANLNQALEDLRQILQSIDKDRQQNIADPKQIVPLTKTGQKIENLLIDPSLRGQEVTILLTPEALEQIALGNGNLDTHNLDQGAGINPTPIMINGKMAFIIQAKFAGGNRMIAVTPDKPDSTFIEVEYSELLKYMYLSVSDNNGQRVYPKDVALYPQEVQSFILRKKHKA